VSQTTRRRGRCLVGERAQNDEGLRTLMRLACGVARGRAPRKAVVAVVASWLVMLFGATSAEAVPSVSFTCSPAPQDCSGWYRSNVSIDWTVIPSTAAVIGCQDKTYTTDTAGTDDYCRANDGTTTVTVELKIRVDKTRPAVTGGSPARGADVNGWYNRPVAIAFSGSDQTSGIAACTATTYGGPDSGAASLAGTCTDNAGNVSAPFGYGLKYDATAPVLTGATPERPANAGGWFNRPVRFDVQATDATSGIADCPSVIYGGPESATASFSAGCRDWAGNASSRAFGLKYDATPPPVPELKATASDRSVALSWRSGGDVESVEVARTPGLGSDHATVVFRGPGSTFVDGRVDNGVRYVYEVRVRDAAGNANNDTVVAVPTASAAGGAPQGPGAVRRGRRLLAPSKGAVLRAGDPPLLQWTPVRGARYYNVQLFRRGRKIMSVWPTRPRYQMKRRWTYRGKLRRLVPGKYRWLVWPGFGPRSKADYGRRMGPSTFVVRRST
jgi:hypothetical protein